MEPDRPLPRDGGEDAQARAEVEAFELLVLVLALVSAVIAGTYWAERDWLLMGPWAVSVLAAPLGLVVLRRRRRARAPTASQGDSSSAGAARVLGWFLLSVAGVNLLGAAVLASDGWDAAVVRSLASTCWWVALGAFWFRLARRAATVGTREAELDA